MAFIKNINEDDEEKYSGIKQQLAGQSGQIGTSSVTAQQAHNAPVGTVASQSNAPVGTVASQSNAKPEPYISPEREEFARARVSEKPETRMVSRQTVPGFPGLEIPSPKPIPPGTPIPGYPGFKIPSPKPLPTKIPIPGYPGLEGYEWDGKRNSRPDDGFYTAEQDFYKQRNERTEADKADPCHVSSQYWGWSSGGNQYDACGNWQDNPYQTDYYSYLDGLEPCINNFYSEWGRARPRIVAAHRNGGLNYQDGGIVRDTSLYTHNENAGFVTDQEPGIEEKKSKYRLTGTTKLDFKERKISKFDKLMDLLKDR